MGKRILIAEDEKAIREFVVINLQRAGYETVDGQFGLVVRHENGELETVRSGEVSVRGLYGYAE